ncbi:MAG: ArnT family glycosyltransferase [Alphaproteobacteria bacterium]
MIRRDLVFLLLFSIASQLLYLFVLPISIGADSGAYLLGARFFAGDPHGVFYSDHPPGYAFLILVTVLWPKSFDFLIALQALIGILCPAAAYCCLRDVNRGAAFVAGMLVVLSGVPYVYAKELLAEHVFLLLWLIAAAAVARFVATRRPGYAVLATAAGATGIMMRNEGLFLLVFAFFVMLWTAWPNRRPLRALVLSAGVALVLLLAWSAERARIMGDPALIGTLNNKMGHQLYVQVYTHSQRNPRNMGAKFWDCVVIRLELPECKSGDDIILVRPENGPATRRIAALVRGWAAASGYDPDQYVAEYFAKPLATTHGEKFWLPYTEAADRLGLIEANKLLLRAYFEAVKAHPAYLFSVATDVAWYFGVSLQNLTYQISAAFASTDPLSGTGLSLPASTSFFANHIVDPYEALPGDDDRIARQVLPPDLLRLYKEQRAKPISAFKVKLHRLGDALRNLIRNAVGIVFLLAWSLFFVGRRGRHGVLSFYLLGSLAIMIGGYALAVNFDPRYEHIVLPALIVATVMAVHRLLVLCNFGARGAPARAPRTASQGGRPRMAA